MRAAQLIDTITAMLRHGCPPVPTDRNYRVLALSRPRGLAQVWFRTRGCRYRVQTGGCTVCDYGVSQVPTSSAMVESVAAAISELPFEPRTLVLSASGSVLDSWEVPLEARCEILGVIARHLPRTTAVLETHLTTITRAALGDCVGILGAQRVGIEFGLECADPAVLKFCLNRQGTLPSFHRAISVTGFFAGVRATANVLVGIPFLTPDETIRCALDAVDWALLHGVSRCVLFPVNIRPYTLAYWLLSRGHWSPPTLWNLVDVLTRLPVAVLDRVDIAWFAPDKHASPPSSGEVLAPPRTCPRCYDRVVALLTSYADGLDRLGVCAELAKLNCDCRAQPESASTASRPLADRLLEAYESAAVELLGSDIWHEERDQVMDDLAVVDFAKTVYS